MRRFLHQAALFLGVSLAILMTLEIPIQWNYHIQNADMADWQKLGGINADIVFIGNSRTWHSLDAHEASQKTGINIYALAQDGWQARLLNRKLRAYLQQNRPSCLNRKADQLSRWNDHLLRRNHLLLESSLQFLHLGQNLDRQILLHRILLHLPCHYPLMTHPVLT